MKQKFKQILKVSFIFAFFCFTSCVNDDFVEKNPQKTEKKSDYLVKRLSNNDLKNNTILKNRIEKFSRKKDNFQQRNIYYSGYGFSIDTDDFLFIGNDNIHTYTFNVEKDVQDQYVENLVLKHTGNNNYIAFLIRYDLTQQDKEAIAAGQSISNYLSKAEFAYIPEINGSILGTQNRTITYTSIECNDVVIGRDYTETYDENGVGHWELITYYEVVCEEVTHVVQIIDDGSGAGGGGGGNPIDGGNGSSGGGGTGGGGGNGNPGNGPTSGNTGNPPSGNTGNPHEADPSLTDADGNPILTTPIIKDRHKIALNKLTTNNSDGTKTKVKEKIDELKARLTTDFKEMGYHFIKDGNDFIVREPVWRGPNQVAYSNGDQIAQNTKVVLHMHQNTAEITKGVNPQTGLPNVTYEELVPIWSNGDIDKTAEQFGELDNDIDFTSILVTQEGTFALRVEDSSNLNDTNLTLGNDADAKDKFDKDFNEKVLEPCNGGSNSCYVEKFIEFLNTHLINGHPIGLVMYQAVFDNQGNIINWIKK